MNLGGTPTFRPQHLVFPEEDLSLIMPLDPATNIKEMKTEKLVEPWVYSQQHLECRRVYSLSDLCSLTGCKEKDWKRNL